MLLCAVSIYGADYIYLPLGCLVKESFPRPPSLLGISARVEWWASCISLCGLFSCGLGNLILTQSLIWEATSTVLFYFSHWGTWNHDEAYLNQRICIETHLYYICNFIWWQRRRGGKIHTDLGWIRTALLSIIHSSWLPSHGLCQGSLILDVCGDGCMDMLDFSLRGRESGYSFFLTIAVALLVFPFIRH